MHAFDDEDDALLLERFEKMRLKGSPPTYFDVEDLEFIINHYFSKGDSQAALEAMDYGIQLHPESDGFLLRKARYEIFEGSDVLAADYLEKAATIDNDNWEFQLLNGYLWTGKNSSLAISYFKKALEKTNNEEDEAEVLSSLASEYQAINLSEEAIACYEKLMDINPFDELAMLSISICFDDVEDPTRAIAFFEQLIDKTPFNETAWFHLGVNYAFLKLFKKAVTCFDFAVVIDDYFIAAYYEKSRCQEQLKNWYEAIDTLKRCAEVEDIPSFTFYKIGSIYSQIEEFELANRFFEQALEADSTMAEPVLEMALIKAREGKIDEAVTMALRALEMTNWTNNDFLIIAIDFFVSIFDHQNLKRALIAQIELEACATSQLVTVMRFYVEQANFEDGVWLLGKTKKTWGGTKLWAVFQSGIALELNHQEEAIALLNKGYGRFRKFLPTFLTVFPHLSNRRPIVELLNRTK